MNVQHLECFTVWKAYYFDKKEQKMYTLKNETGWAVLKDVCNVQRTRTTNTPGIGIGYYCPSTM